jgi:RNA-directed DNA polymerase
MAEDTSGNPGVVWPDPERADYAVRRMQLKLHRWAGDDRARRFHDLYNRHLVPQRSTPR